MKLIISRTPKRVRVDSDKLEKPKYFKSASEAIDFAIALCESPSALQSKEDSG